MRVKVIIPTRVVTHLTQFRVPFFILDTELGELHEISIESMYLLLIEKLIIGSKSPLENFNEFCDALQEFLIEN